MFHRRQQRRHRCRIEILEAWSIERFEATRDGPNGIQSDTDVVVVGGDGTL